MMNTFISKFAIIPPNKQVVTKERLRLTLTVMVMKTTFVQDCKKSSIALVGCRLIILSCSSKIYILYLYFGL